VDNTGANQDVNVALSASNQFMVTPPSMHNQAHPRNS
jgi:hypothetical protein